MAYNDIGNITFKTGVGDYYYNSTRVHAIDSINGSQYLDRQNISYNSFNKPVFIASASDSLVYTYNVLDERIKSVLYDSTRQLIKTRWYSGLYERTDSSSVVKHYDYINSPDGPVALVIQTGTNSPVIYYLCKDHLGSITGIMDSNGNMLEELNYDPWGKRRNPEDWSYTNVAAPTYTERGFTGHEHVDKFNLINMNGRIFDPEISRFLSPDPVVQNPYNLLNYNRYSYCLNNPLKFTDPSGYDYQKIMEDYYRDQQNSIPPAELFNNYPGGWIDYQKAIAKGSWQYYLSSSFRDLFPNSTFTTEYEYDGSPAGYWIKTTKTKVVGANTPLGHYAGDVEVTKTFIPFNGVGSEGWYSPINSNLNNLGVNRGNNTTRIISDIANGIAILSDATNKTLTSTKVGSDIAYLLSNSKVFIQVTTYLKPISFGASGLSVFSDVVLSFDGQQSWGETGLNAGITGASIIIGGWPGLVLQIDYQLSKAYIKTIVNHQDWVLPHEYHSFIH